jgi:hypothetical protein
VERLLLAMATEKMEEVEVTSGDRFEELLDGIVRSALNATGHWDLLKKLDAAISDYREEMTQSEEIWGFTLSAHYDVVLFYLSRLYDQDRDALSLERLLLAAKSRARFPEGSIRERLPFGCVSSVEESVHQDLACVSASDSLVKRLSRDP